MLRDRHNGTALPVAPQQPWQTLLIPMILSRAAVTLLAALAALPAAVGASLTQSAFIRTPFCQTYGCAAAGSLAVTPELQLDLYTLRGSGRAELRIWRDGDRVPGAAYVLHRPAGGGESKFPVIAGFLTAATGVSVTAGDVRRAGAASRDEVRRAQAENSAPFVVHLLHGGVPYTLQVVNDGVESGGTPDWALTVRLYRNGRIPRLLELVPDVWGLRPVLSFLRENERAAYGLDRWLDLTPAQRTAFERLVAEDAAFVQAAASGTLAADPAAVSVRMTALLRAQDGQLRRLLGGQYARFRAWVQTNWASQ